MFFLLCVGTKTFASYRNNLDFWPRKAKFGPYYAFLVMPDQKTMRIRCLGGFSVMWVTKLLISLVKIGFFAQKSTNLARKWHFCSFWARPCRLIWLVVVARGLYLARHLFTLYIFHALGSSKVTIIGFDPNNEATF